jgi:type III secretion protein L
MEFFSLITGSTLHIKPGTKIIPEKDFSELKTAADVLNQVRQEALDFKKKNLEEAEILKQNYAKEGFDEGLNKFNSAVIELNQKIEKIEKDFQNQLLPIALKAAKKILGEELKLHPDRIVDIVIQALKPVLQQHKIKIYANKEDLEILEKEKEKILSLLQKNQVLTLEAHDDVERGGCLIETESGMINAQLENQWRALEAAFKSYKEKKNP